jgi:hypothetical protein
MSLTLRQLRIGKVDGKHEYLTPKDERGRDTFDAFLIPDVVEEERLHNADIFFVEGFRGTGKTSLLRWHAERIRAAVAHTDFILFKSDLTEMQRQQISKEVGITWTDVDSQKMEIAQDFKDAWTWFILHKIGEIFLDEKKTVIDPSSPTNIIGRLLGLLDDRIFKKSIGFMPKLEGGSIRISADVKFFEAELKGDFKNIGDSGKATLEAINKRIIAILPSVMIGSPIYIYFDELEVFYHTPEQHARDQRMVRDLLFSIAKLNDMFRNKNININIIAAVRSEVIDSIGSLGQEVDRLVHDRGFLLSWHHAKKSLQHPLIQIIRNKILVSERAHGINKNDDPIGRYFPTQINQDSIETFLLDRSFYKPRDIVWRLSIAQKLFPNRQSFAQDILEQTEIEYSSKLWEEIRYELSATYSSEEINAIEMVLSGGRTAFDLEQIDERFDKARKYSSTLQGLLPRRSVREIMADLYRLGAVGNSFRAGSTGTDIRNRWSFRGDQNLLPDKRMVIHPALNKRLSAVSTLKRGSRPGRR